MNRTILFRIFNKFLKDLGCRDLFWKEVAKRAAQAQVPFKLKREQIKYCCACKDMIRTGFLWDLTYNGRQFWELVEIAWHDRLNSLWYEH